MTTLLELARLEFIPVSKAVPLHDHAYEALAIAILCAFACAVSNGSRATETGEPVLLHVESFIAESYSRSVTLNDMARAAGVSRQHLLKLCRLSGKPTPTDQLYAKRLEVASDLLLHTGFSMAEIAEQTGFLNQFHFSRQVQAGRSGADPSAWRGGCGGKYSPRQSARAAVAEGRLGGGMSCGSAFL